MLNDSDIKKIKVAVRSDLENLLKSELKPIKNDIAKMRIDISTMIAFFDKEVIELRTRVSKIEEILNIKP